jgi:hypothetical protein
MKFAALALLATVATVHAGGARVVVSGTPNRHAPDHFTPATVPSFCQYRDSGLCISLLPDCECVQGALMCLARQSAGLTRSYVDADTATTRYLVLTPPPSEEARTTL